MLTMCLRRSTKYDKAVTRDMNLEISQLHLPVCLATSIRAKVLCL